MSDDTGAIEAWMRSEPKPTSFEVWRGHDESGLSGTGKVLEGIVYSDESVAIHWCGELTSWTAFPDWATFYAIHTGGHPTNETVIRFASGHEWRQSA